ncbi:hypothetical protein P3T33_005159 [Rhizobium sp. AN67]|nr:hypothetical protein [Rhizobium sp. AN67]SOD51195.1 hypothetical protein SAMN05216595_0594 [Rhizobium sp. AN6A]
MKSVSKWISPILPRGASKYFDDKVFRLINYFNIFFISALFLIYVTDISTMALSVIEPATTIPGIFSFMLERYRDFESVKPGQGAFFVVANIILLAGTMALLVAILSRFISFKERLPAKFTKSNIATPFVATIFIFLSFRFLFFSDLTCSTCGTIASRSLNSPLIIIIIPAIYTVLIESFIQIFSAGIVALATKE